MSIVFIGAGNMARALIGGLIARNHPASDIRAVDPSADAQTACRNDFGIAVSATLDPALSRDDVCVLAVKPQLMRAVCESIAPAINGALVVSVAAGTTMASLSAWLGGHARLARAMPNTPALIGLGVAGLVAGEQTSAEDRNTVETVLRAAGETVWFDEEAALDAVTAISGSGPAYVFRWMEAMQTAAHSLGVPADKANTLILHTVRGAAELALRSDHDVATLREQVTSLKGTTAAGLDAMNVAGLEHAVGEGVRAAHARSVALGRGQ